MVVGVGGADEPVEGDAQLLLHALEDVGIAPRQFGGRNAFGRRGFGDLQAVLVGAGQEPHVESVEPLEAGDRVGGDVLVGVTDVRRTVRIRDRGGDVIGLH